MKPSYKYLEHTADVLFVAQAASQGELFEQCGLAVEEAQVPLKNIKPKQKKEINLENSTLEKLLFDFLDELLFLKDTEGLIFSKFKCKVEEKKNKFLLKCKAQGDKFDPNKHEQKVDAKAITMHMYKVEEIKGGWKAQVLVDI